MPALRAALAASLIVFVAACEQKPADSTAPAASTSLKAEGPDASIQKSVALLKQGDFAGLMQHALPPAEFAKAKADWGKDAEPVTDEDRKKFADTMGKLVEPDAETKLYAELEPQLKTFDATYQQQIPMYVSMGSGWLQGMIQQNKDMSEAEKQQALAAVNALAAWVQKTRFTDPEAVKKVIAIVTKTARSLNIKSADEARALTYEQSMDKARTGFQGVKDVLGVYGFSLDQTLDSVKSEVISNDGKTAKVKISYTLFDTPLTGETEMVNLDGRWYGKHALEKAEDKPATPAEGAQAPAAGAAAQG
jgi:hypothetical protein